MLDTFSDPGENEFLDALEEITVSSDSGSDCHGDGNFVSNSVKYDVWTHNPESVESRRSNFFNWLGLDGNKVSRDDFEESSDFERAIDKIRNDCGDGDWLSRTDFECEFLSTRSSMSCLSCDDSSSSGNSAPKGNFVNGIENIDTEMEGDVGDQNKESISDIAVGVERRSRSSTSSSFSSEFSSVKITDKSYSLGPTKKVKKWWVSRLRSFNCVAENEEESFKYDISHGERIQRVKVHQCARKSKELSALYHGQSIQAHKGAILSMQFSCDGRFLASAGEDGVLRVWQVIEDDRSNMRDVPDMDPSSVYFTMNQLLELKPMSADKEKNGRLKKTSDSACVVLPPKVFRVKETPLNEFRGHTSEILDLSWSKSNYLLSSSVDKTVRLWQVGNDNCLKVFPHNNYVTCVEFNPVDENNFVSGSIDGKVRIWERSLCKVVYWTEVKDIVTAVCYRPDGRGGIIGSITGNCRFFNISDHQLQLDAQISLQNKKSSGKRVTGFQFFPQDPTKVMISCADSQVRIVQGVNIIGKYKGVRSTGSFSSAHFTSDGRRIISASEDSSVHIWKCADHGYRESSQIKKVKSSERFVSNASVALPWPGFKHERRGNRWQNGVFNGLFTRRGQSFFSPAHFSCGQSLFQESNYPKGSALWPEEKLLAPSKTCSMHKSEYKFLRSCQSRSDSHAWGMVIVTAGWDGRIRAFHNYGLPVPH